MYPLAVREGEKPILEEPITFSEMYRRKMSHDLELAKLKKLAKIEQQAELVEQEKTNGIGVATGKGLNEILA